MKGIIDTDTTLSFLVSTKSSTTLVVTPVLVCVSGVSVISLVTCKPATHSPPCAGSPDHEPFEVAWTSELTCDGSPAHVVCQLFQTVPNALPFPAITASKFPSLLTLTSGSYSVSCQISVPGVSLSCPSKANTWYGLTFNCLDALSWFTYENSEKGNVIKSPVCV